MTIRITGDMLGRPALIHAPLRTRQAWSSKSPLVTPVLRHRMRERDIFKIKAIQSKDPNHYKSAFIENERVEEKTSGIVNELTKKKTHINIIEVNGTNFSMSITPL